MKQRPENILTLITMIFFSCCLFATEPHEFYPPIEFQKQVQLWLKQGLGITNFNSWLFKPGALFGSPDIWWKSKRNYVRTYPHEGIDFYYYQAKEGNTMLHVPEGTPVPLIYSGTLLRFFKDFIGLSLIFSTDQTTKINGQIYRFYVLYAHVKAIGDLEKELGKPHKPGDVLFTYNQQNKNFAPPHLHLTTFWADKTFIPKEASWDMLDASPHIMFTNPLVTSPP